MKIFEGKSQAEKNKLILAMVLGFLAFCALTYTFSGLFFGGKKPVSKTSASPTPSPTASSDSAKPELSELPSADFVDDYYANTPVYYNAGNFSSPDAARNIFAFYEPPVYVPTPFVAVAPKTPTPVVQPTLPPSTPPPPPPVFVANIVPSSVYAGTKDFNIEVNGDKFTPDTAIFFNGSLIPTTFVSSQKLTARIPASFVAGEGGRTLLVQTPDGSLYSNQIIFQVMPQPRPQLQYVGFKARSRYNNDVAYFVDKSKVSSSPSSSGKIDYVDARLNDVIENRFRIISISKVEVVVEDTSLGFRHKIPMVAEKTGATGSTGGNPGNPGNPNPPGFPGTVQPYPGVNPEGIPANIPRYVPPQPPNQKKDEDYDDEDGDN